MLWSCFIVREKKMEKETEKKNKGLSRKPEEAKRVLFRPCNPFIFSIRICIQKR